MKSITEELDPLFNPKTIAVIGASKHWNKWGNSTFSCVIIGFAGKVYPINKTEAEVLGHKAYRSILDVPDMIDLVIFVIPSQGIVNAVEECVQKGIKAGIIISAGFREIGEEGKRLEEKVLRIARKGNMRFVGPNCMGVWSATSNLRAFMFPLPAKDGPVAFVTQGGNVGGAIVSSAFERGLGLRRYVSCGPAADIQIEDYIEYFGQDDGVKVIMAYIEGLNDGKSFLEKVSRVTTKKPVIVLKPGRSEIAARAILSHSGALAGADDILDKAMKKAGIIRVNSPEELLDVTIGFLSHPLPSGNNVGIITGGGSYGVICAEDCSNAGLNVADLPESTIEELNTIFPPRWSRGNPIDPAGDRNFLAYYMAPRIIMDLDEIDALIFMGFGSLAGFSSLFDSSGPQIFINRIPSALASIKGLEKILDLVVSSLQNRDDTKFKKLTKPMIPFVSTLLGSDTKTIEGFIDVILTGDTFRSAYIDMNRKLSDVIKNDELQKDDQNLQWLFDSLDSMISALLVQYMKTYEKPIISTTFSDIPVPIKGGSYPYSTSSKATRVLATLIQYRKYLEQNNAYKNPFQCCCLMEET